MVVAMAHLVKYGAGAAGGILKHDERTDKDKVESRKNESIDSSRTSLNYNLAPARKFNSVEKTVTDYTSREEIHFLKRKDVNVMCSWVVTLPASLNREDEQEKFFKKLYSFLSDRYGHRSKNGKIENILTATVHLDETTPHMHFGFIPVAYDKNKERYTVSAKIVNNRSDLQSFHKELSAYMTKIFEKDIGIENGVTKGGNMTTQELKYQTAKKRIEKAEQVANTAEMRLNELQSDFKATSDKLQETKKVLSELTREHEMSEKALNSIDLTPKKLTGGFKGLSPQQAQDLKLTAEKSVKYKKRASELAKENDKLRSKLDEANREIDRIKSPLSRENILRAEKAADKENQLNLLKDVLNLPRSANYDECRRQLISQGIIQSPNRKRGLHR